MPLARRFMGVSDALAVLDARRTGLPSAAQYPIKEGQTINLPAASPYITVVTFTLPANMEGMLLAFAYGCFTVDDFSFVRWQLRINGQAPVGYDSMLGPMATFVFPEITQLDLPQGSTVTIVAQELGGVLRPNIAAGLWGRFWPMGQGRPDLAPLGIVR